MWRGLVTRSFPVAASRPISLLNRLPPSLKRICGPMATLGSRNIGSFITQRQHTKEDRSKGYRKTNVMGFPLLFAASPASTSIAESTHQTLLTATAENSHWFPVQLTMDFLSYLHDATGSSWLLTVVGVTVALRLLVIPFNFLARRNMVRLAEIRPFVSKLQADAAALRKKGKMSLSQIAVVNDKNKELHKRVGSSPWLGLTPMLVQMPFFISLLFALKGLSVDVPSMAMESFLWVPSLAQADGLMVLPFINALTMGAMMELGSETGQSTDQSGLAIKWGLRAMCVAMPIMTSSWESIVFIFWITGNLCSLAQGRLFNTTFAKNLVHPPTYVPAPPKELEKIATLTLHDLASAESKAQGSDSGGTKVSYYSPTRSKVATKQ